MWFSAYFLNRSFQRAAYISCCSKTHDTAPDKLISTGYCIKFFSPIYQHYATHSTFSYLSLISTDSLVNWWQFPKSWL